MKQCANVASNACLVMGSIIATIDVDILTENKCMFILLYINETTFLYKLCFFLTV